MDQSYRNTARNRYPLHDRAWRDLARFAGEAMAAGLFASLVLALATFIVSAHAAAAGPPSAAGLMPLADSGGGADRGGACYPFDPAVPGGTQRFVAAATADRSPRFQPPRPLGVGIVVSIDLGSTVSMR
jgi:hypothetical protein